MAFKKILVALDRTSQAPEVFETALDLSRKEGSNLMVFHCISWEAEEKANPFMGIGTLADVNMYGTLHKLRQDSLHQEMTRIQNRLQTYSQEAASQGVKTEFECKVGNPSGWICEYAKEWGADLIILGRRGYSGWSEFLLGSVSNFVLHHAPCSVLVVQDANLPEAKTNSDTATQKLTSVSNQTRDL